jgi:glutaredoxin
MPDIIVYSRERYSPDVERTRERLTELDLLWVEHDIELDEVAGDRVEELTGKRRVPTVVLGDIILIEPSNEELDAALRHAGYEV